MRTSNSLRPSLSVCVAWLVLMAGVNLATPLYAVYAQRFGFSSFVLTAVFATYAVVLVPALIIFGRLSDRFGRRPVVLVGLGLACVALWLFVAADGTGWLFAARAALVEIDPDGNRRRAALLAGLAQAGGSAAGPLLAGVLAQWAPWPRQLCYVVGFGATLCAALLIVRIPEPVDRAREPWRVQLPRVPAHLRVPFVRVSLTAAIAWAAMGLFLSIIPSYAADLLDSDNLALLALVAALALLASCAAQIVVTYRGGRPARDQAVGLALLGAGLVVLIVAAPLRSLPLMVAAGIAAGFGHGLAFLNAQQELNELAPQQRRGEITAAFIACIYALLATAVVGSGLLDEYVSLTVAVAVIAAFLAALASAVAVWHATV